MFPYRFRTDTGDPMPNLAKKSYRADLPARREPHWERISAGQYIGFRKTENGRESWIARRRDEHGRQHYQALGDLSEQFQYDQAAEAARVWFKDFDRGVVNADATVATACAEYLKNLEAEKGATPARTARHYFERTVTGGGGKSGKRHKPHALARVPLRKIRSAHVKEWRDGLKAQGLAPASVNRTLTYLRAALNLAVASRLVGIEMAQEWREVKPLTGAAGRRQIYLDLGQRKALLAATEGALRDLVEAAVLTGARPGELVAARRAQFDERTATITLSGKTGTRTVPLSPVAVALFKRLAKDKLPTAYLLTRPDGKPWGHSDWDELVRAAVAAAKLPAGTTLYCLRHSWITEQITSGMSLLQVARITGTSLRMIDSNYGHLAQQDTRDRLAAVAML